MKKRQVKILGLSYSQSQVGSYILVLSEMKGKVKLPVIIKPQEAQRIALDLEGIKLTKPLTHDLFKSFADRFHIIIKQVIIHKLVDGVFYSSLICERDNIEEIIDTRTSDAIALATRFNAPIFTYENILDKAGIYLKIKDELTPEKEDSIIENLIEKPKKEASYTKDTLKQLNEKLDQAVLNEDYELAAKIRDEINKRTS